MVVDGKLHLGLGREPRSTRLCTNHMMKRILDFLRVPPAPPESTAHHVAAIDREIVRLRSHGNIRLQEGKYYTQEDVDRQYERIIDVDFGDSRRRS